MFEDFFRLRPMPKRNDGFLSRPWLRLWIAGRVTVLFFLLTGLGSVRAESDGLNRVEDPNGVNLCAFEFTCELQSSMGQFRLDGLMASDGCQDRIAVYWTEPAALRDTTSFLQCSDFIFAPEIVHYWIDGMKARGIFPLSDHPADPLLPRGNSLETAVRSSLAILSRIGHRRKDASAPLEIAKFFRASRARPEYTHEILPLETDSNDVSGPATSDVAILNALPYGREYSKETQSDGTVVWRATKASTGGLVVSVTVNRLLDVPDDCPGVFDPGTLGQWTLLPDAYRMYWSLNRGYRELGGSSDVGVLSRELYDRIESYLHDSALPARVARALDRLRFKTAMVTNDMDRVCRSAQAFVEGLCQDQSVDVYQRLLELARISGQIEKHYPQQTQDWLRPLVEQMVKDAGGDAVDALNRLMPTIDANNWFTYGELLLEEIRREGSPDEDALNNVTARFEASRMARNRQPPDPCESSASVKQYLAHLDADPPPGEIDMNDLRHILEQGLAKQYADSDSRTTLVEDVIRLIRLIVGEGPFCGNQAALIGAIDRFSVLYLQVGKARKAIDTALATFLALSFCDTSTPEDHDALISQFRKHRDEFQSQVSTMLSERGLSSLVTAPDVEGALGQCEHFFRVYIDDPLCPAFKFPWTRGEETRLAGSLRLHLMELERILDAMALKVKYGGACTELKNKMIFDVSRIVERLLPEAAFLRTPPYPGVSCHYRGTSHGLTATVDGRLYREGNRARERFKAMKHFHLGHRLEEFVKHEALLAEPPKTSLDASETDLPLSSGSPRKELNQ